MVLVWISIYKLYSVGYKEAMKSLIPESSYLKVMTIQMYRAKSRSVIKYVDNNLMSIGFTGRKEDDYVFGISCVRIGISYVSYCMGLNDQKADSYVL